MRFRFLLSSAVALAIFSPLHAQLQWSVFNETTTVAAPVSTATSGVAITVPAAQRVTLIANNLVPIDLTRNGTEAYVTISFKVSGGLSGIAAGTRAIGYGLFNNNGTATNYDDDSGYFTWLNGRNTGSLIEQRRRIGNSVSPSLLNATGTAVTNMSTGQASPTPGSLNDGSIYSLTLHLMSRGGAISFGNTTANTTGGGIILDGPGIRAITFSNPDAPASAFVFNQIGFMFLNTTASEQTLTITSVSSSNNAFAPINPPAILAQPAAISLNPAQAGTLTVSATGTAPLAYQWRRDGTALAGATGASFPIASAATTDAGNYSVVITNAYGTVTSSAAALTITTAPIPPTITGQPASATVNVGDSTTFSVAAFGSSPVTYQWRKDGVAIAGATSNSLTLSNVAVANAGAYTVTITNATAAVTSAAATLAVNTAPAITLQPASVTASVGQNVTFSVAATGSPAPTYQWSRNSAAIAGASSASLTVNNVQFADTGVYTVSLINEVGAVTSAAAVLAIPSTMTVAAVSPANNATAVNIDTPLSLTFDRAPVAGRTGRIRIFKASDDAVVATTDLGASIQQRTVGTNTTLYNFIPVAISGNIATIYVHAGVLTYGQSYYVQVEPSAILDSAGGSFTGIADKTTWRFTTKPAGPASATAITVAADGSGDFTTVQGAIDSVPVNNDQRVVINVKKGSYNEIVYIGATRPLITIRGEDRAQTIVGYRNNSNLNGNTATRAVFSIAANDTILETITVRNPTPQGGSQAEAVFTSGQRVMLNRVNLLSRQDTLLTNSGTAFITDSYIEGNVDFMWGSAAAYYQRCELKALDVGTGNTGFYTQFRNGVGGFGSVYVDCKLTAAPGVAGTVTYFLGRIDPGPGNFPYSQCVFINSAMGPHISPAGWRLDNATASSTIQYWEYRSTDLDGALLDVSRRHPSSRQLSESEAALWRNPAFVLGGWSPQVAPSIETSPAATSAVAGSVARLSVVANGSPVPSIQWFKDGVAINGATSATLVIPNVQPADAGNYSATVASALGSVTSAAGRLTVTRGPLAGVYFGTLGGSATGTFALYLRDDGSGVFLGQASATTLLARNVSSDAGGRIVFAPVSLGGVSAQVIATGTVNAETGAVSGSYGGITFTGARAPATGASAAFTGFYATGANGGAQTSSLIVGANGQAFVLAQTGATLEGGTGTIDAAGVVTATLASGARISATVAAGGASAAATLTPATGAALVLAGANDRHASAQRLRQFSARAHITGANPSFAGFVIAGAPANVLLRAVGPTLADAFAVGGALPNPRLDLYRGATLLASNTNWATSTNSAEIALGAVQSGTFPFRATVADSAIRLTLAPGAYTAVMSSANGTTSGIGLVEVYEVSNGNAGQRLTNVSTRGTVGNGANVLIAGVVVVGTQPKRMLIRAVGPGLAQFGVSDVVTRPVLTLYRGTAMIASNTGWTTGGDPIATASATIEAGTFAFGPTSADSALLISLAPGVYSAQVSSADAVPGSALIEIYELP